MNYQLKREIEIMIKKFISIFVLLGIFINGEVASAYTSDKNIQTLTVFIKNNLSKTFSCALNMDPEGHWTNYMYTIPPGKTVTIGAGKNVLRLQNNCTLGEDDTLRLTSTLNGDLIQPDCFVDSNEYICSASKNYNPNIIIYDILTKS